MKISEAIDRLLRIMEKEGDIQIELPGGTLLHRLDVFTVAPRTANESPTAQERPAGRTKK
jgi:hypothetical protein